MKSEKRAPSTISPAIPVSISRLLGPFFSPNGESRPFRRPRWPGHGFMARIALLRQKLWADPLLLLEQSTRRTTTCSPRITALGGNDFRAR
ncbi:hypothetical protein Q7P37_001351 [Cladosporium fusiforme]